MTQNELAREITDFLPGRQILRACLKIQRKERNPRLFADPDFDGEPVLVTQEEIDAQGKIKEGSEKAFQEEDQESYEMAEEELIGDVVAEPLPTQDATPPRKYYVDDGVRVKIVVDYEQSLDLEGNKLRVVKYTDHTSEKVKSMSSSAAELLSRW